MNEQMTVWDLYFAGIASIRFHPKNDCSDKSPEAEVALAAEVADMMMEAREARKCQHG